MASAVVAQRPLSTRASVVVVHRLSCSKASGIFLDQGSNLCPLHWPADSYPLYHQGSPVVPLNRPPSAHFCSPTVYSFHSSQSDFLETFIPFPEPSNSSSPHFEGNPETFPWLWTPACSPMLFSKTLTFPLTHPTPHSSSYRPDFSCLWALTLSISST